MAGAVRPGGWYCRCPAPGRGPARDAAAAPGTAVCGARRRGERRVTFVVRRRRPFLVAGSVLLAAAVAAGSVWWVLQQERRALLAQTEELRVARDALARSQRDLEARNERLANRVTVLERARQVESQAYAEVDRELSALQDRILDLDEELAFYKGIVSDGEAGPQVRIQRFAVERDGTARDHRFRLVLTRGIRSDKVVVGSVTLAVDGERDGERLRLSLDELTPFPVGALEYRFKHFQRLEGRLRLPPRFVPVRVVVRLDGAEDGVKPVRETFPWPSEKS